MKLSCKQFEELIPFYINDELSDALKKSFIEHFHNCPNCHLKFNMLNSIVNDLKNAYNKLIFEQNNNNLTEIIEEQDDDFTKLSAYIDNELEDDLNVQIRRNIVAKPSLRKKFEKLYNVRKMITNSFNDEKSRLKTDFSKDIIKKIQTKPNHTESYVQCFIFLAFVISMTIISIIVLHSLL